MLSFFSPSKAQETNKDEDLSEHPPKETSVDAEPAPLTTDDSKACAPLPEASATVTEQPHPTTWKEAHWQACRKQNSLTATPEQALTVHDRHRIELPTRNDVLLWNDAKKTEKLAQLLELESSTTIKTSPGPSRASHLYDAAYVVTSPVRILSKALLYGVESEHGDVPEWKEEGDDAYTNDIPQEKSYVQSNDVVLNVDLTVQCLRLLSTAVRRGPPTVLWLHAPATDASDEPCWHTWLQTQAKAQPSLEVANLLPLLPESQSQLLLECLQSLQVVEIVRRSTTTTTQDESSASLWPFWSSSKTETTPTYGPRDVVVLGKDPHHAIESRLAQFDLQHQQRVLLARVQVWTEKAEEAERLALAAKRRGQESVALLQLRRRKLLYRQIESTLKTLQTVETTLHALETAEQQRTVIQALSHANDTLRQLRLDTNHVDDVLDDLVDERDRLQEVDDTLASFSSPEDLPNEDDLMKELEALVVDDTTTTPPSVGNGGKVKDGDTHLAVEETKPESSSAAAAKTKDQDGTAKIVAELSFS